MANVQSKTQNVCANIEFLILLKMYIQSLCAPWHYIANPRICKKRMLCKNLGYKVMAKIRG